MMTTTVVVAEVVVMLDDGSAVAIADLNTCHSMGLFVESIENSIFI